METGTGITAAGTAATEAEMGKTADPPGTQPTGEPVFMLKNQQTARVFGFCTH